MSADVVTGEDRLTRDATRKMLGGESGQETMLHPSWQRLVGRGIGCTALVIAFVFVLTAALSHVGGNPWEVTLWTLALLFQMVFWDLVSRRSRWAISISASAISGPTLWFTDSRRVTIPRDRLDGAETSRRSLLLKLVGGQCIRGVDGSRIYVHRWAFDRKAMRAIVEFGGGDAIQVDAEVT